MFQKKSLFFIVVLFVLSLTPLACQTTTLEKPFSETGRPTQPVIDPTAVETLIPAATQDITESATKGNTPNPQPSLIPTLEEFCSSQSVQKLLQEFDAAVQKQDGQALAALTHPSKGLTIRHESWNPEVKFPPSEVPSLFTSTKKYNWGNGDGSGLPIEGSFLEIIQPRLLDVLKGSYTRQCNTLESGVATGGTTGQILWTYSETSFFTLYRSAPKDVEMDWRTWAVGIEFVANQPYITILVQYHWEI
jgi:hypothetical protein